MAVQPILKIRVLGQLRPASQGEFRRVKREIDRLKGEWRSMVKARAAEIHREIKSTSRSVYAERLVPYRQSSSPLVQSAAHVLYQVNVDDCLGKGVLSPTKAHVQEFCAYDFVGTEVDVTSEWGVSLRGRYTEHELWDKLFNVLSATVWSTPGVEIEVVEIMPGCMSMADTVWKPSRYVK